MPTVTSPSGRGTHQSKHTGCEGSGMSGDRKGPLRGQMEDARGLLGPHLQLVRLFKHQAHPLVSSRCDILHPWEGWGQRACSRGAQSSWGTARVRRRSVGQGRCSNGHRSISAVKQPAHTSACSSKMSPGLTLGRYRAYGFLQCRRLKCCKGPLAFSLTHV